MSKRVAHTADCCISWLEKIEDLEPLISPVINELAKIKVKHEEPSKEQLLLPLVIEGYYADSK